ncbi:MAG: hypothetical protein WCO11_04435 [Sphingomonadales bacterium]
MNSFSAVVSVRDPAHTPHIRITGLPAEEATRIALLADILGWTVETVPPLVSLAPPWQGAARMTGEGAAPAPARLRLRCIGSIIRAEASDPAVAGQLAARGLDRLVMPVPLTAWEDLLSLAG